MEGPSQPGYGDLTLAEFQAKLLARGNPHVDEAEERMHRFNGLILRWAALTIVVAALLTWFLDAEIAAIVTTVLTALASFLAWTRRDRENREVASLNDQP